MGAPPEHAGRESLRGPNWLEFITKEKGTLRCPVAGSHSTDLCLSDYQMDSIRRIKLNHPLRDCGLPEVRDHVTVTPVFTGMALSRYQ